MTFHAPLPALADAATPARLWALLPCAGSGTRAQTQQPKQYVAVAGQPMVLHTLAAFGRVARLAGVLVVVAPGERFFDAPSQGTVAWQVADCGGATRADTVAGGLDALCRAGAAETDWVLVHDAARCLVEPAWIDRLIDACGDDPVGGLLAQPVADTLKRARLEQVETTVDRSMHWLAQTPQMFRIGLLRRALRQAAATPGAVVTDESSAIEALGLRPRLVRGSPLNLKVTYPEDFVLAEAVLRQRQAAQEPRP